MEKSKPNNDNFNFQHFKIQLKKLYIIVRIFFKDILNITEGTDYQGTTDGVKRDIIFRGHSIWILIASIFIAAIGLNQNSVPVIIGAMLISPLMGPIVGIGFSVGTNDWDTLRRSTKYFAISVFVSIVTSTIYFFITPLKDAQSELFARTQPTLLDVLVAVFGGVAGIVAGSRSEKSHVIPGVAIATALMPPLCTAGYGLATFQLKFFLGGFYLFFINSVFISISTLLIVRYLNFPVKNFISKEREKKFKIYMIVFVILVILPSSLMFWNLIQESRFKNRANQFIEENFKDVKNQILYKNIVYHDTLSEISIFLNERKYTDSQILDLNDKLKEYGLGGDNFFGIRVTDSTALLINQERNSIDSLSSKMNYMTKELSKSLRVGILEDIYKKQEGIISGKNERIAFLENQLIEIKKDSIPVKQISKELGVQYPDLQQIAFARAIETYSGGEHIDTFPVLLVRWNKNIYNSKKAKNEKQMLEWLKIRLNFDTLKIVRYN